MTNKALDRTANAGLAVGSAQDTAEVVASLVMKGDISGLGPEARTRYYLATCEGLGLNPNAQPFAFLRLNGKEVMYATRGATDQLAAMHRVTRKIIDGPKVVTVEGTKMVYAVCEASLPNGRAEQSTATLPVVDPVNMLMKCETKAKRRATLSILGLAILDEMETETIPGAERIGAARVEHQQLNPVDDAPAEPAAPSALDSFRTALDDASDLAAFGEAWAAHALSLGGTKASAINALIVGRATACGYHLIADEAHALCAGNLDADLAATYDALAGTDRAADDEDGDGVIADVVRVMRRASGLRTDLKKRVSKVGVATAEALGVEHAKARITAALNPPPPPTGTDGPACDSSDPAAAIGATVAAANAQHGAAQASAEPRVVLDDEHRRPTPHKPELWQLDDAAMRAHVAGKGSRTEIERAAACHGEHQGPAFLTLLAAQLVAIDRAYQRRVHGTDAAMSLTQALMVVERCALNGRWAREAKAAQQAA